MDRKEDKVISYAKAFTIASMGILILSYVPSAIEGKRVQTAKAFNLMADGHRLLGLAKNYDAKTAALALKTVTSEVL